MLPEAHGFQTFEIDGVSKLVVKIELKLLVRDHEALLVGEVRQHLKHNFVAFRSHLVFIDQNDAEEQRQGLPYHRLHFVRAFKGSVVTFREDALDEVLLLETSLGARTELEAVVEHAVFLNVLVSGLVHLYYLFYLRETNNIIIHGAGVLGFWGAFRCLRRSNSPAC